MGFSGLLGTLSMFDPTQKKIQTSSMKACLEIKREIALTKKAVKCNHQRLFLGWTLLEKKKDARQRFKKPFKKNAVFQISLRDLCAVLL